MTLKDDITSDLSVFFNTNEFAETVTYNGTDIPAIVEYEENLDEQTGSAVAIATLTIKKSDVSDPDYLDTVVIGSDTWKVRNRIEGNAYIWKLALYRDERPIL